MIHDVIDRWHQHMHGEPGVLDELLHDDVDRIIEFRVMVRPLQAVNAVHRMMGAQLDALGNH